MLFNSVLQNANFNFVSQILALCCVLHLLKSDFFIQGGGGDSGHLFLIFLDLPLDYMYTTRQKVMMSQAEQRLAFQVV